MPDAVHERAPSSTRDGLARHDIFWAGTLSGLAGGIAMMLLGMAAAASEGLSALLPMQVMGETFVGPAALEGGAQAAYGLLVHLAVAVLLGVTFATIVPRDHPLPGAVGLGLGVALLAMGLLVTLVTPWANPGFRGGLQPIGGTWVIAHALFGAVIGTAPAIRRRLSHGRSAAPSERGVLPPRVPVAPPRNA